LAGEIYDLHLEAPLERAEPDRKQTFSTALEYAATVYDAVYITLSCSLSAPLITAEKTTTAWVVKMGDQVRHVGTR
jgi:predicted nucleic acid-binding protein